MNVAGQAVPIREEALMNITRERWVLASGAGTQRALWRQAAKQRKNGSLARETHWMSRTCVAILAAVLLLPAGEAAPENALSSGCDTASAGGGIFPAAAGSHGAHFNEGFGLNAMAKGDAASPFPFR